MYGISLEKMGNISNFLRGLNYIVAFFGTIVDNVFHIVGQDYLH